MSNVWLSPHLVSLSTHSKLLFECIIGVSLNCVLDIISESSSFIITNTNIAGNSAIVIFKKTVYYRWSHCKNRHKQNIPHCPMWHLTTRCSHMTPNDRTWILLENRQVENRSNPMNSDFRLDSPLPCVLQAFNFYWIEGKIANTCMSFSMS